jgi:hypothetical protein
VKKYPVGRIVTVFYDKNDPTFCVLEPNALQGERFIFLLGILIVLILSAIVFAGSFTRMLWLRFLQR